MMCDVLIKNGVIVDGTGRKAFKGDIAVKDGIIQKVGDCSGIEAKKAIDANGRYVTPGFIDAHSHADMNILLYPEAKNYLMQGVTTVMAGNCGVTESINTDPYLSNLWNTKATHALRNNMFSDGAPFYPLADMKKAMEENYGIDNSWSNMKEFIERINQEPIGINLCQLTGLCQIRVKVMGTDCMRKATDEEIEKMKAVLREELDSGAFGLSTGLIYFPNMFSDTHELIELAKVVKEYDGIYTSHIREIDGSADLSKGIIYNGIGGLEELIQISKETGVKTQASHLLAAFHMVQDNNIEMNKANAMVTLKLLEKCNEDGGDITFDVISTELGGGLNNMTRLRIFISPLIKICGSKEQFVENLQKDDYIDFAIKLCESMPQHFQMLAATDIIVPHITACKDPRFVGKSLPEIMKEFGWKKAEAIINIIKADFDTGMRIAHGLCKKEHVELFTKHPLGMPSADIMTCDETTVYDEIDRILPMPSAFHFMIKFLTDYRRDSIEDTIRSASGFPAQRFGIEKRGELLEGNFADIVIFDENNLNANVNFNEPRTYPKGIDYVLVNGSIAVEEGKYTGVRGGKAVAKKYTNI